MDRSAPRRRPSGAMISARLPTARSSRSCRTGSIAPSPNRTRRTPLQSGTPTSVDVATTTEQLPDGRVPREARNGGTRSKGAGEKTKRGMNVLPHPTHDRLIALGLIGMAKAFEEQRQQPAVASLTFEERLGLLVDREAVERASKRLVTRLKFANLRQNATIEDLNTKAARGLDKALFAKLATGDWIGRRQDLLITGKTGTGKSWLACALAHKACRDDRSVLYYRVPRLLDALALARGDGRHARLLKSLARVELLILDDWGLAPLTSQQGRDLLEIVDDRDQSAPRRSLARAHRRSDNRRCHPRPPGAHRASPHARRRDPAQASGKIRQAEQA